MLIKKNVLKLDNFKGKSKDNKIELSNEVLNNIPILIGTINDLINVINLRIELTDAEKECIQTIKTNVDEIKKIFQEYLRSFVVSVIASLSCLNLD